jgi:hypothetical protein
MLTPTSLLRGHLACARLLEGAARRRLRGPRCRAAARAAHFSRRAAPHGGEAPAPVHASVPWKRARDEPCGDEAALRAALTRTAFTAQLHSLGFER